MWFSLMNNLPCLRYNYTHVDLVFDIALFVSLIDFYPDSLYIYQHSFYIMSIICIDGAFAGNCNNLMFKLLSLVYKRVQL